MKRIQEQMLETKLELETEELPYEEEIPKAKSKSVPSGGFLTALLGMSLVACLPQEKKEQLEQLENDHENVVKALTKTGQLFDKETAKLDEVEIRMENVSVSNPFSTALPSVKEMYPDQKIEALKYKPLVPEAALPQIEVRVNEIMNWAEEVKNSLRGGAAMTYKQLHDDVTSLENPMSPSQLERFMSGLSLCVDSGEVAVTWSSSGEVKYRLATTEPSRPIKIKNGSVAVNPEADEQFLTYKPSEEQKRILEEMALTRKEILDEDTKFLTEEILQLLTKSHWQYRDLVDHFQGMYNVKLLNEVLSVLEDEDVIQNECGLFYYTDRIQKQQEKVRAERKRAKESQKAKESFAALSKAFNTRYNDAYQTVSSETAEVVTVPFGNTLKQNIATLVAANKDPQFWGEGPRGLVDFQTKPNLDPEWSKAIVEMKDGLHGSPKYIKYDDRGYWRLTAAGNSDFGRLKEMRGENGITIEHHKEFTNA